MAILERMVFLWLSDFMLDLLELSGSQVSTQQIETQVSATPLSFQPKRHPEMGRGEVIPEIAI